MVLKTPFYSITPQSYFLPFNQTDLLYLIQQPKNTSHTFVFQSVITAKTQAQHLISNLGMRVSWHRK